MSAAYPVESQTMMDERISDVEQVAPLAQRLRARIEAEGPVSFRDWMAAALYDERDGYYQRSERQRWGRAGDYRTSPERSPLFAATCAGYFASLYEQLSAPPTLTIIEAGAGAGDFARGVLETLHGQFPNIFAHTRYLIDEASADARGRARKLLQRFPAQVEWRRLANIKEPVADCIVFSNELLDALPVHRVAMRDGQLLELCVGVENDEFVWVECELTDERLAAYFEFVGVESLAEGRIAEVNLAAGEWLERTALILERGFVVTVDYGAEAPELFRSPARREGTLRAFQEHRLTDDVLREPGARDLTTTIDWTYIKRIGEENGLHTLTFERQDEFLLRNGLLAQLEHMTAEAADEAESVILRTGVRELILPGGMSESFQVLVQRKG